MTPHLDTRVIRMVRWLLDQESPRSTEALAADLGLGARVVRYRLDAVEGFLRSQHVRLVRQRGAGVWIDASEDRRQFLREMLAETANAPRVYARDERDHVLLSNLLWIAPETTSLDRLHGVLEVSKASARRDLKRNEEWLERRSLLLARRPGVGVSVAGQETRIRQALVQLTIEAIPEEVLAELCVRPFDEARLVRVRVPAGMREHLARLPLQTTAALVSNYGFGRMLSEGNSELVFCVYLAVTAARLADGHEIAMDTGQHRSLADHPVAETAAALAPAFEAEFSLALGDLEIAGITRYLLGLATLSAPEAPDDPEHGALLNQMMSQVRELAGHALGDDPELRRSLALHLERLSVRLKYGLPVHNPLLAEVQNRYPDVHTTAIEVGTTISRHFGVTVTEDEIGYLTMYLAGALERTRLRAGHRAIVVCPSGMATAWVLVSRLQAEFPQFELVTVLSSARLQSLDEPDVDLVISTVELPDLDIPVVVVNPLLTANDIRRLGAFV